MQRRLPRTRERLRHWQTRRAWGQDSVLLAGVHTFVDSTQKGQTEGPSPGTCCSHSFMLGRVAGQAVPSRGVGERLHNSLISSSFFPHFALAGQGVFPARGQVSTPCPFSCSSFPFQGAVLVGRVPGYIQGKLRGQREGHEGAVGRSQGDLGRAYSSHPPFPG